VRAAGRNALLILDFGVVYIVRLFTWLPPLTSFLKLIFPYLLFLVPAYRGGLTQVVLDKGL